MISVLYKKMNEKMVNISCKEWYASPQKIHSISLPVQDFLKSFFIYFLFQDDVVVYVGQTNDVFTRIKTHAEWKVFNRVSVISVPESDLNIAEEFYINMLKPKYNKKQGIRSHYTRRVNQNSFIGASQ